MPISEYEINNTEPPKGAPVIIKLHSSQRDMTGTGLFGDIADGKTPDELLRDASQGEAGIYSLTTEGFLCDGDELSLFYKETEELAGEGITETEIAFPKKEPKSVTIRRGGPLGTGFVIEEGKRHYSVYNTPYGSLEMCVYAKRVDNRLTEDGGVLILDYAVELKGMTAQRTKMRVDVKRKTK